jgi:ubiquinone/menaquinone biosynthesis C-methylase UbiE
VPEAVLRGGRLIDSVRDVVRVWARAASGTADRWRRSGRRPVVRELGSSTPDEGEVTPASAASRWDREVGKHLTSIMQWNANSVTRRYDWQEISGDGRLNPLDWFMRTFGPFHAMASICCGSGVLERHLGATYLGDAHAHIDGYDVSPGSIAFARENCKDLPRVAFHVCDVNTAQWHDSYLDAVFANGALHHVTNLDHCLGQLARALKPSGFLYVNDYVGPRRFQFSDLQLELAREILAPVPERFVRTRRIERCDAEALASADPSEAVCSDEILTHIRTHFEIVEQRPGGGTLLAPIFGSGCIEPGAFASDDGLEAIAALCRRERDVMNSGRIPATNIVVVARPRR